VADYTINDTMADLTYQLDDRFIYNDIRSELGYSTTETILDDTDPAVYEWRLWQRYHALPAPGYTTFQYFTATVGSPLAWRIRNVTAHDYDYAPYTGYTINLIDTSETLTKAVEIKNTGSSNGTIGYIVEYKLLISEAVEYTHEETTWNTLQVRATDSDSIDKYGRRTMNLVWPTGATENQMQAVVDRYCEKYREPAARLTLTLKGKDDTNLGIIYQAEVSETVQVINANLGLNDLFYIDSIEIHEGIDGIPVCVLGLTDQYTTETYSVFTIDTSEIDGTDYIG